MDDLCGRCGAESRTPLTAMWCTWSTVPSTQASCGGISAPHSTLGSSNLLYSVLRRHENGRYVLRLQPRSFSVPLLQATPYCSAECSVPQRILEMISHYHVLRLTHYPYWFTRSDILAPRVISLCPPPLAFALPPASLCYFVSLSFSFEQPCSSILFLFWWP